MTLFADSSALVKLYATEADSKLARNLVQVNTTVISSLAWVEVPAAAGQCHRHPNHGRMRRVPMLRQGTSGRCRS